MFPPPHKFDLKEYLFMSDEVMSTQVFGDYQEELPEAGEYLNIGFSPSNIPLKERWENNGLSADFIAEYFRTFYVGKQAEKAQIPDEIEIENLRDAVKYIANELLENAMKFQDKSIPYAAHIFLSLHKDKIIFCVTNGVRHQQAERFKRHVQNLLNADPNELYLQTMRNSAQKENQSYSGLGLLSMICDYGAKLGWKFEYNPKQQDLTIVTTMVILFT